MRSSTDFRATVRRGVRVGRPTLVVHAVSSSAADVLVGFVVSKSVGNAVTRNRVKRRLRHLAAECLPTTPAGSRIVVRALPAAGVAAAPIPTDLPVAWRRAIERVAQRGGFS